MTVYPAAEISKPLPPVPGDLMLFGDTSRFAIEVVPFEKRFAGIRIWIGGTALGDIEELSVMGSLQLEASAFLKFPERRLRPSAMDFSIAEIQDWTKEVMHRHGATDEEWVEIGRTIHAICLYPYAPEGLSSVRITVVCDESCCSVTGWDVETLQTCQVKLPAGEVDRVVRQFVAERFFEQ